MRLSMLSLISLAALSAACGPATPGPTSSATGAHPPMPGDAEVAGFAKSSNALGFDLYGKAARTAGNVALSPISVAAALTMTWGGARGETAAQMKKVLHAEASSASPSEAMDVAGHLLQSLGAADAPVTLRVANRLFGEKTYPFDPGYLDHTRAAFGAPLEAVDFKGDFEPSRAHINDWVATQTQDRIKDLIPKGGITADTRLVLTNAIYFLGDWASRFDKDATRPLPFHTTATAARPVPTMNATASYAFAATDGVEVLEMPYVGGDLAMTLVLPDDVAGLAAVEKRLTTAALDTWIGALRPVPVHVALPKFEIDPAASLSLGDMLIDLGMPLAFDSKAADFTAMSSSSAPTDRLSISKVFHKAFVKVDEKGTEAAAATAVVMQTEGAIARPEAPAEFTADHPFLFFVRHVKSGAILFMGRVSDPAAK